MCCADLLAGAKAASAPAGGYKKGSAGKKDGKDAGTSRDQGGGATDAVSVFN